MQVYITFIVILKSFIKIKRLIKTEVFFGLFWYTAVWRYVKAECICGFYSFLSSTHTMITVLFVVSGQSGTRQQPTVPVSSDYITASPIYWADNIITWHHTKHYQIMWAVQLHWEHPLHYHEVTSVAICFSWSHTLFSPFKKPLNNLTVNLK